MLGAAAGKEIAQTFERVLDPPSKEVGNYLTDKIRFLRYRSLLKIVDKAGKEAQARGLSLKMPPIKFFVPFCEAASLEEEEEIDDSSLSNLWANLLVSASTSYDSRYHIFLRIVKEITKNEVNLFDLLVNRSRATTEYKNLSWTGYDSAPFLDKRTIGMFMESLAGENGPGEIIDKMMDGLECPGVRFLDASITENQPIRAVAELASRGFHYVDRPHSDIAMSALEGLNIGEYLFIDDVAFGSHPYYLLSLSVFKLTELGVAFLDACGFQEQDKIFKDFVDR